VAHLLFFFFFQAEDGIRDYKVTGVQTCALPIFWLQTRDKLFLAFAVAFLIEAGNRLAFLWLDNPHEGAPAIYLVRLLSYLVILRSEERRVGKECSSRSDQND